jgi:cyclopropane fatty-acyl-phospholipid synthase-like methyltransferase
MFNWGKIQYRPDGKILLLWRHERVFEEGLVKPEYDVLDIGGWGHFSDRVIQEKAYCTILDLFTEDQYYSDRVRQSNYIEADICSYTDYSKQYDLITCGEVLEHVSDPYKAILNMYSLLKTNGWLAGTIPIPGFSHAIDDEHVNFIDQETITDYLIKAQFKNLLIETTASINKDDLTHPCIYFKGQK